MPNAGGGPVPRRRQEALVEALRERELDDAQLDLLERYLAALLAPSNIESNRESDFASDRFCMYFGRTLQLHHAVSNEAFTKDKCEHGLVEALRKDGRHASLAPRGNPGHDLTVDDVPWSVKTQADVKIRIDTINISKFMELGKGQWKTAGDLLRLRDRMLEHMNSYDRVLMLRRLSQNRGNAVTHAHFYELVEIPKGLLQRAQHGEFEWRNESKQSPKPGYCHVADDRGQRAFSLYFDGGTERKLQIRHLRKDLCTVHATWAFNSQ